MAFGVFGKRRRDGEQPETDEVLAAAAAQRGLGGQRLRLRGSGQRRPLPLRRPSSLDPELAMPRWRRPSLLEARRADPTARRPSPRA